MEKFSQFGIEPVLLAAQIVNFLVLLYLLKRLLYKPILEMLKKREEKIREGLAAGARGEELLVQARDEEKEILHKASEESELLIETTKENVMKLEEEMLGKAKEKSEHMLKRIRVQIGEEERLKEKELARNIVHIATDILERALPKLLTREDQVRIIEASQRLLRRALP